MKKAVSLILAIVMVMVLFTGCGSDKRNHNDITVISREDGSGTREGFIELMGIKVDGKDRTVATSEISSSTSVIMITVAGNPNAIGYISLGSLNDTVKAVKVDGIKAAEETIKIGEYPVVRPFNIVTKSDLSKEAEDFITFIMSKEGQAIISDKGYIPSAEKPKEYVKHNGINGRIVLAGSTSVAPVMESLADAYKDMYQGVEIEIQQTGSGAGITSTIEGACDIGMASRNLKEEEAESGITQIQIALDGIVVIVNKENKVDNLSSEQIRKIFMGEITTWEQ